MTMGFRLSGLVLVVVMVGSLLLSSCATSSPSSSNTDKTGTKPYGKMTVAIPFAGASSLDPQLSSSSGFSAQGAFVFDTLMYIGADNKLLPGIAERYEIAADGLTQTFYIRKGVKFHDGSDLTAADVKFSMERMMASEVLHMDAPAWRASIASIELKDDYTVVVRMKQPSFELIKGEGALGMAAVVPKKYIEEKGIEAFRKNFIGSGPWKVLKYEAGTRIELEAVESHWRNVPKFQYLTVLNVAEEASKVAMLKTGELDMAEIAPDSVAGLKAAGVRQISYDADLQYWGWLMWDKAAPEKYILGDVKVRTALQMAVNSQEIANSMFGGKGRPFALTYISPTSYFFDSSVLKPTPYDPEGAKKLLAEAGHPNGFKLKVWDLGGGSVLSQVAEATSGYLRKIGINTEMSPMEYATFYKQVAPTPLPPIMDTLWVYRSSALRQFDGMLTGYHSTKGVLKNPNIPRLDELIDKVPQTKDPAEKKRLAAEAAKIAFDQHSGLRIVSVDTYVAVSSQVGDMVPWMNTRANAFQYETITHAK